MTSIRYDPRRRVIALVIVLLVAVAGLVAQLMRIQVFDQDRYVAWGEDQRLTTTALLGRRGDIVDRHGEELAISVQTPYIYADPALVSDPVTEADVLAGVLDAPKIELQQRLAASSRFVYLQRPASDAVADAVADLGLAGVFIGEEPNRFHPNGASLARGVLGAVGVDGVGLSGIEAQYDASLVGTPGRLVSERGLNGRTIPEGDRESLPAIDGVDVHLTLDRALQFQVERALVEHVAAQGAKGGTIVVAEPGTGDVLAMASVAATDDGSVVSTSDNRAVTWVYEPASVMKAVTFAAVLDRGIAGPRTTRVIEDEVQLYDQTFSDDHTYEPMRMSTTDILVRSSNTGTITWALELGASDLHDYLRRFGFGTPTGLGFPGESPGLLDPVEAWSGTHIATTAIGQSIAVTPMQMLTAYNVIANGGVYVQPRIVSRVGDEEPDRASTRPVINAETADNVTAMLTRVVEQGTATAAKVPGYAIAAKTGTAWKVQESGGYRDAAGNVDYIATVAGFFPAENPEFSMIVIIDEPANEIYASRTAAPLFGELAAWTLRHFQVSPEGDVVFEASGDEAAAGQAGPG